jgi:DNA-binding IclR family transcriptional regulator
VSISGPTGRMARAGGEAFGAQVRAAADRITRAIGGTAP